MGGIAPEERRNDGRGLRYRSACWAGGTGEGSPSPELENRRTVTRTWKTRELELQNFRQFRPLSCPKSQSFRYSSGRVLFGFAHCVFFQLHVPELVGVEYLAAGEALDIFDVLFARHYANL